MVGEMRSGKDTFAKYFIERKFQNYSFGSGIAEVINTYFPDVWKTGKPRKHYQVIGQSFRMLDPLYWIKILDNKLKWHNFFHGEESNIIVTDLRQPNEYDYLKSKGFYVIKVYADLDVRIHRAKEAGDTFDPEDLNHETEIHIKDIPCDYFVTNNGTLDELLQKAEAIYKELGGTK